MVRKEEPGTDPRCWGRPPLVFLVSAVYGTAPYAGMDASTGRSCCTLYFNPQQVYIFPEARATLGE